MRQVTQSIIQVSDPHHGGPVGDCLRASIASLLDLDPADVPHFGSLGITGDGPTKDCWWHALVGWCLALSPPLSVSDPPATEDAWPPLDSLLDGHCLASGPSPRGDYLHSVVARAGEVTWDPHPSREGLPLGITYLTIFTAVDI